MTSLEAALAAPPVEMGVQSAEARVDGWLITVRHGEGAIQREIVRDRIDPEHVCAAQSTTISHGYFVTVAPAAGHRDDEGSQTMGFASLEEAMKHLANELATRGVVGVQHLNWRPVR